MQRPLYSNRCQLYDRSPIMHSLACFAFAYLVRLVAYGKCKRVRGFVEEFTLITLRIIARSRATSRISRSSYSCAKVLLRVITPSRAVYANSREPLRPGVQYTQLSYGATPWAQRFAQICLELEQREWASLHIITRNHTLSRNNLRVHANGRNA